MGVNGSRSRASLRGSMVEESGGVWVLLHSMTRPAPVDPAGVR